jgi:hypothetical protein
VYVSSYISCVYVSNNIPYIYVSSVYPMSKSLTLYCLYVSMSYMNVSRIFMSMSVVIFCVPMSVANCRGYSGTSHFK